MLHSALYETTAMHKNRKAVAIHDGYCTANVSESLYLNACVL